MVALRSLFLTGLVVAVNSKREIMNEDENRVGFTPVSQITFLEVVNPKSIATLKEETLVNGEKWVPGQKNWDFWKKQAKFAKQFAVELGGGKASKFDEQVEQYDVKPHLDYLDSIPLEAQKAVENLSHDDFHGRMWARLTPAYVAIQRDISDLGQEVINEHTDDGAGKTPNKKTLGELEKQLMGMEGGSAMCEAEDRFILANSPLTEGMRVMWTTVKELQDGLRVPKDVEALRAKVVGLGAALNASTPVQLKANAVAKKDAFKMAGERFATRQSVLAENYVAGRGQNTMGELMKLVSFVAVGVVIGAFAYDVYTRKSDTVHAPGEGLV